MKKSIKVLELFGEPFAVGGEETIVYNIYENMDKENIQIDFLAQYSGKNEEMRKSIEGSGSNFFAFKEQKDNYFGRIKYFKEVKKFLKKHDYDIVHIHSGSIMGFVFSIIATHNKKRFVIVHAHNTGIMDWKKELIKKIFTPVFLKANKFLGCSQNAIECKFPKQIFNKRKYEIIKNGIDYKKFIFNIKIREDYRIKLKIEEKTLALGFVGRLVEQKNPLFLVNILEKLITKNKNIKLYIIGDGKLRNSLLELIKEKKLEDYVVMLGNRNDVNNIMQVLDILLLPSLFEGLGIVAVEAQSSGLPVIVSQAIPDEAKISKNYFYKIYNYNSEEWADMIMKITKKSKRKNMEREIISNGYDIKSTSKRIKDIYMEGAEYGKNKRK